MIHINYGLPFCEEKPSRSFNKWDRKTVVADHNYSFSYSHEYFGHHAGEYFQLPINTKLEVIRKGGEHGANVIDHIKPNTFTIKINSHTFEKINYRGIKKDYEVVPSKSTDKSVLLTLAMNYGTFSPVWGDNHILHMESNHKYSRILAVIIPENSTFEFINKGQKYIFSYNGLEKGSIEELTGNAHPCSNYSFWNNSLYQQKWGGKLNEDKECEKSEIFIGVITRTLHDKPCGFLRTIAYNSSSETTDLYFNFRALRGQLEGVTDDNAQMKVLKGEPVLMGQPVIGGIKYNENNYKHFTSPVYHLNDPENKKLFKNLFCSNASQIREADLKMLKRADIQEAFNVHSELLELPKSNLLRFIIINYELFEYLNNEDLKDKEIANIFTEKSCLATLRYLKSQVVKGFSETVDDHELSKAERHEAKLLFEFMKILDIPVLFSPEDTFIYLKKKMPEMYQNITWTEDLTDKIYKNVIIQYDEQFSRLELIPSAYDIDYFKKSDMGLKLSITTLENSLINAMSHVFLYRSDDNEVYQFGSWLRPSNGDINWYMEIILSIENLRRFLDGHGNPEWEKNSQRYFKALIQRNFVDLSQNHSPSRHPLDSARIDELRSLRQS